MSQIVSSFFIAALFGFGLSLSEMINPARVIGFLDVAGQWDPTLLLVMAGAVLVTASTFPLIQRRKKPVLADQFAIPARTQIDPPLLLGSAIFGIGWGLAGFCPGPALAALTSASPGVFLFVAAMAAGQWLAAFFERP